MTAIAGYSALAVGLALAARSLWPAIRRRIPSAQSGRIERRLEQAGRCGSEASGFQARRLAYCGAGLAAGLAVASLIGSLIPVFILPAAGAVLPNFALERAARRRRREIVLALPYYLDVLALMLEAGLDLVASVEEIATDDSPNALRDEFLMTLKSIRMGTPRACAFQDTARRIGEDALVTLAASITESEELGSGLGKLLRIQAESLRRLLFRQAEERAQAAPLRMLVPLIGLIFPVTFLLLFTPLFLELMGALR